MNKKMGICSLQGIAAALLFCVAHPSVAQQADADNSRRGRALELVQPRKNTCATGNRIQPCPRDRVLGLHPRDDLRVVHLLEPTVGICHALAVMDRNRASDWCRWKLWGGGRRRACNSNSGDDRGTDPVSLKGHDELLGGKLEV